jgi:ankyrin repeat protein
MSGAEARGEKGAPSLLLLVAGLVCAGLMAAFGAIYWFRLPLLHRAIRQNDLKAIKLFLYLDPILANSSTGPQHFSVLTHAILNQEYKIMEILLDKGADPNIDKGMPLQIAATRGYQDVIEKLIAAGADLNADQGIALGAALKTGRANILTLLLDRGANPRLKNASIGACMAIHNDYFGIAEVFIERGADIHASDPYWGGDEMLLRAAVAKNAERLIWLLLSKGADPHSIVSEPRREQALRWAEKLGFAKAAAPIEESPS